MNSITRIVLTNFICINRTPCRHVRGVQATFRQRLPRYKNSLFYLPEPVEPRAELAKLWAEKLNYYKAYMPINQHYTLLEALLNPSNGIDQLLGIIDENLPTMNSFYFAISFETLHDMIESDLSISDTILVSPEFRRLCRVSLTKIRFFDADEVLKLVKCLSKVKVPEDTLICQSAFQMTRHLINDFSPKELTELHRSLAEFNVHLDREKSLLMALRQASKARLDSGARESITDDRHNH